MKRQKFRIITPTNYTFTSFNVGGKKVDKPEIGDRCPA
jgi:hypothetical protein